MDVGSDQGTFQMNPNPYPPTKSWSCCRGWRRRIRKPQLASIDFDVNWLNFELLRKERK